MLGWFKRKISSKQLPMPLEGAPEVRRQKTYQSQSGFVYQYYFAGSRRSSSALGPGFEFIFPTSSGPKQEFMAAVHISDAGVSEWERNKGRELLSKERYAIAKMALFAAFDGRSTVEEMREPVLAGATEVAEYLEQLGRG
jgi:hypothetical protein